MNNVLYHKQYRDEEEIKDLYIYLLLIDFTLLLGRSVTTRAYTLTAKKIYYTVS